MNLVGENHTENEVLPTSSDRLAVNVEPLHGQVLVEMIEPDGKTPGGLIVMSNSAMGRLAEGIIVKIGVGSLLPSGTRAPMQTKVGDRVMFGAKSGLEMTLGGIKHRLMEEEYLKAKVV